MKKTHFYKVRITKAISKIEGVKMICGLKSYNNRLLYTTKFINVTCDKCIKSIDKQFDELEMLK